MNLCVIPARGGSKRIPRKNIKTFAGKPMIAHAISAAKASGLFAHIVVSTDDEEISNIAIEWGAEVPFVRPLELSDDHTPTVPVVAHAAQVCKDLGWQVDYICCIYPCVPFIQAADIVKTFTLLEGSEADYSFPIAKFPSAIQRALKRNKDGLVSPFSPKYEIVRTQDLKPAYYDAGQFYWGAISAWETHSRVHSSGVGYILPSWRVVDIDDSEDWHRAERLYRIFTAETEQ